MTNYTYSDQPNSYFEGHDLRVGRENDGRVIITNVKDGFWAMNVKADWIRSQREANVRNAADNLTDDTLSRLEGQVKEFFWEEVGRLAVSHGFSGTVYQQGRSGGWLALDETHTFEALHPANPVNDTEKGEIERWLDFCFDVVELQEAAEKSFDEEILDANQALQFELSEYADWVGGWVESLDGYVDTIAKLTVRDGRACLETKAWYSFAKEGKLVRKADASTPSRLTADPVMQQVFEIIEARGDVTGAQLTAWLDADDDNDPTGLYEQHIAPGVNAIEDEIKESL